MGWCNFKLTLIVIFSVSCSLFFASFFSPSARASNYYLKEEFSSLPLNVNYWDFYNNQGTTSIVDDHIRLSAPPGSTYPYILLKDGIIPSDEYSIELSFKLGGSLNFGHGIILTDKKLINGTTSDLQGDEVIFHLWPDTHNKVHLISTVCLINTTCVEGEGRSIYQLNFDQEYIIKITSSDNRYVIQIDGHIFETTNNNRKITNLWFGNPQSTGGVSWGYLEIGHVYISDEVLQHKVPLILIPGFGGSWNYSAILGRSGGEEWRVPDWIDTYDNLVNSLVAAGYTKDKDLFVFGYDWRKSFVDLAADLDSFIADLRSQGKISADTGINLVSHSYGGLIMNQYLRNNSSQTINKALSLGSPYRGVYQAYLAWAGGIFELPVWWQKAGAEVVIQVNKAGGDSNADVIRRMMPSIRDMLPLYPFIEYRGVVTKTKIGNPNLESLYQYLKEEQKPAIIAGNGFATIETVKVMPASTKERKAGLWPDGKPYHTIKSDEGDDTVLVKSSQGLINTQVVNHNHGGLVTDKAALETILSELGLDGSKATALPYQPSDKAILAVLQSPGVLQITKEGGLNPDEVIYDPSGKLAMLPGYDEGIFTIMVKNNGEYGRYRLLLGYITTDSSSWKTFKGELTEGDSDNYRLKLDNGISDFTTDEIEERPFGAWLEELRISVEGWMPVAGRSAALAWIKTIKGSPDKWRLNELREAKNKLHAIWVMARDNEQSETKYLTEITLVLADRQFAGESKTDFWQMKNRYLSQLAVLKKISNNIDRREEYGLAIKTAVEAEALRESNRTKAAELYYSAYLWLKDI